MTSTLFDTPAAPEAAPSTVSSRSRLVSEAHPSAWELLADVFARVLEPVLRIPIPEWTRRHRVMTAVGTSRQGGWRHGTTPYLVQPMRLAGGAAMGGEPRVREIVLVAGGQSGKTEFVINVVMAWLAQNPCAVQWTIPNEEFIKTFIQPRFYPAVRAVPSLMDLVPTPLSRSMTAALLMLNNGAYIKYASSQSDASNVSTPAALVVLDETDTNGFNRDIIEDARTRGATFDNAMLIQTSVPSDEGVGIDYECSTSQQRRWQLPCPLCGFYQPLEFRRLDWIGGVAAPLQQVRDTLRYTCVECRKGIVPSALTWMSRRGWWVRDGVSLAGDGRKIPDAMVEERPDAPGGGGFLDDTTDEANDLVQERGTPKQPDPVKVGYRVPGMASLLRSNGWIHLAEEFVNQRGAPTRKWVNSKLGEPFGEYGERSEPHELRALCSPPRVHGGYLMGELPGGPGVTTGWGYGEPFGTGLLATWGGPRALAAAVDVQRDRMYFEVAAYGLGGVREWLVWVQEIPRQEGRKLVELDPYLDCWFEWQTPPSPDARARGGFAGCRGLRLSATVIDSGKYHDEVYECVLRNRARGRNVLACKGTDEGRSAFGAPYELKAMQLDAAGHAIPSKHGGLQLLTVRVGVFKDKIHAQQRAAMELIKAGGGDLCAGRLFYPCGDEDAEGDEPGTAARRLDEYFRHICAEHRAPVKNPDGRFMLKDTRWVRRPGIAGKDNHYLDCRVYRNALVEALGVRALGVEDAGDGTEAQRHRGTKGEGDDDRVGVVGGAVGAAAPTQRLPRGQDYLAAARERLGGLRG